MLELIIAGVILYIAYRIFLHESPEKKIKKALKSREKNKRDQIIEAIEVKKKGTVEKLRWLAKQTDNPNERRYFNSVALLIEGAQRNKKINSLDEARYLRDECVWVTTYARQMGHEEAASLADYARNLSDIVRAFETEAKARQNAENAKVTVVAQKERTDRQAGRSVATIADGTRLLRAGKDNTELLISIDGELRTMVDAYSNGVGGDDEARAVLEFLRERMGALSITDRVISSKIEKLLRTQS